MLHAFEIVRVSVVMGIECESSVEGKSMQIVKNFTRNLKCDTIGVSTSCFSLTLPEGFKLIYLRTDISLVFFFNNCDSSSNELIVSVAGRKVNFKFRTQKTPYTGARIRSFTIDRS